MKLIIAGTLAAMTVAAASAPIAPAAAQRVIIGPGGVGVGLGVRPGVGVGVRPYGGYARAPYARGGNVYEGRSAYRGERRGGYGDRY